GWLRDPDFMGRVADGVLGEQEQKLLLDAWHEADPRGLGLHPTRPGTPEPLAVEDVPLLDELRHALGDVPQRTDDDHELDDHVGGDLQQLTTASDREYAPRGRAWQPPSHRIEDDAYAHVLIDEAQDLTPMQWR